MTSTLTASDAPQATSAPALPSLPESHRTVPVPSAAAPFRTFLRFAGPGYLVAVGYMDPGNWATDLAGGSAYGYGLLWVILVSNLMAMLLQTLAARLGIATGRDLAQACRERSRPVSAVAQWLLCEVAICATDLAEVVGTAIALELLFGIPLAIGVCVTALDVFMLLWLQHKGFRYLEALIVTLVGTVFVCFAINLFHAAPSASDVARGLVPDARVLGDPAALYIAVGIVGATVMPHNLYLHSSIVQTRAYDGDQRSLLRAARFATSDVVLALGFAFLVNAAILVLSASAFHASGRHDVTDIADAHRLLTPLLGAAGASTLFGVALLAAGQSSTITATLTGQIVMEGFLSLRMRPWLRRLLTRGIAIVPALAAVLWFGEGAMTKLLIASQVVLSLQLPFAVIPLIRLTSDPRRMGALVSPRWMRVCAWGAAALILLMNAAMLTWAIL